MGISSVSPFANFFVRQDFEDAPDELDAADVAHANWNARVADNSDSAEAASGNAEAASGSGSASASRRPCAEEITRQTSREFEARLAAARAKAAAAAAAKAAAASAPQAAASAPTNAANMSVSDAGVDLVKHFEKLRLTAYLDGPGEKTGVPTIGYGHTGLVNGKPIIPHKTTITPAIAKQLLRNDLTPAEALVRKDVTVPITQGQFDALTSFTFNVGHLHGTSLLTQLNEKNYAAAHDQFALFAKVKERDSHGNVIKDKQGHPIMVPAQGLKDRRAAEAAMFGTQGPQTAASSATPGAASSTAKGPGQ